MDNNLREKAQALVSFVEQYESEGSYLLGIQGQGCFKELKAALRPSSEEIADVSQKLIDEDVLTSYTVEILQYAIEELRRD